MCPICQTWSMTLIRSTPPSSPRLAMSASLKRSSGAPPCQVKSEMCSPSFIFQPYPRRRIAQQMGAMNGGQGHSIVDLSDTTARNSGVTGIVATSKVGGASAHLGPVASQDDGAVPTGGHALLRRADGRSEGSGGHPFRRRRSACDVRRPCRGGRRAGRARAAFPHLGQDRRRQVPVVADVTDAAPVGVIGAGIVGLAVARQLAGAGVPVVGFEKEPAVAAHQTGHNSGVVHAGIYYAPGSSKATMTRHGVALLRAYCADRGLAWDERGKLVVARNEAETVKLRELERRSKINGVPGVQWLTGTQLRELEPDVAGGAALLPPTTAIVDYPAIARSFAADVVAAGGRVLTSTPVTALKLRGADGADGVEADTPGRSFRLSRLVICAGLQADLLAATVGDTAAPEIIPFRGEYLRLRPHAAGRGRRLI